MKAGSILIIIIILSVAGAAVWYLLRTAAPAADSLTAKNPDDACEKQAAVINGFITLQECQTAKGRDPEDVVLQSNFSAMNKWQQKNDNRFK